MNENTITNLSINPLPECITVYIAKMRAGCQEVYFGEIRDVSRGIVEVMITEPERFNLLHRAGDVVRVRAGKCFLWGDRCYWFKNAYSPQPEILETVKTIINKLKLEMGGIRFLTEEHFESSVHPAFRAPVWEYMLASDVWEIQANAYLFHGEWK